MEAPRPPGEIGRFVVAAGAPSHRRAERARPRVAEDPLVVLRHAERHVRLRGALAPRDLRHEMPRPEDLVAHQLEMRQLVVVDGDEDRPVGRQQPPQQPEPRVHHAQPLVVAREVLARPPHHLAQPPRQPRRAHVVVVRPPLLARVVRWVDVDAPHAPLQPREQRLERLQVVAVDDSVPAPGHGTLPRPRRVEPPHGLHRAHRHLRVVVHHLRLAHPL